MNCLKIIEERKINGKYNFYLKINRSTNWPPNSMLIFYVCEQKNFNLQKAMKSYEVLGNGLNDIKIIRISDVSCEIYDSRK